MSVAGPPLGREDLALIRLRLRRRATRKAMRASRIATLRLAGLPHEEARSQMELSVEQYRRARRWLREAVTESLASDGLLTVDEALRQYSERHVEGVIRVGRLRQDGRSEAAIRQHLGIGREDYDIAMDWWRDALTGVQRSDE